MPPPLTGTGLHHLSRPYPTCVWVGRFGYWSSNMVRTSGRKWWGTPLMSDVVAGLGFVCILIVNHHDIKIPGNSIYKLYPQKHYENYGYTYHLWFTQFFYVRLTKKCNWWKYVAYFLMLTKYYKQGIISTEISHSWDFFPEQVKFRKTLQNTSLVLFLFQKSYI